MDLKDIQNLIKFVAKSGASEVKLETEDIKITIKTGGDDRSETQTFVQQIPMGSQMTQAPVAQAPQPVADAAPGPITRPLGIVIMVQRENARLWLLSFRRPGQLLPLRH